jgi:hypothetical protein
MKSPLFPEEYGMKHITSPAVFVQQPMRVNKLRSARIMQAPEPKLVAGRGMLETLADTGVILYDPLINGECVSPDTASPAYQAAYPCDPRGQERSPRRVLHNPQRQREFA